MEQALHVLRCKVQEEDRNLIDLYNQLGKFEHRFTELKGIIAGREARVKEYKRAMNLILAAMPEDKPPLAPGGE